MVIAALVLLIACANIANLAMAAPQRDVPSSASGSRSAPRAGVFVRLLFTESLVLSGIGAAVGLPLAMWGSRVLLRQISTAADTVFLDLSIDWHVLAFTAGIAAVTTLCFGVAPAFFHLAVAPMDALKEHARTNAGLTRGGHDGLARHGSGLRCRCARRRRRIVCAAHS